MVINSLCSPLSSALSSARSSLRSACSVSACEWTDTYSPAAIDMAPATRPAIPATNKLLRVACAAATPSTRLEVERMPSFAPSTAARSQPVRPVRCCFLLPRGISRGSSPASDLAPPSTGSPWNDPGRLCRAPALGRCPVVFLPIPNPRNSKDPKIAIHVGNPCAVYVALQMGGLRGLRSNTGKGVESKQPEEECFQVTKRPFL